MVSKWELKRNNAEAVAVLQKKYGQYKSQIDLLVTCESYTIDERYSNVAKEKSRSKQTYFTR